MKTLKLAKGLDLPADEAVTQKYGCIGRSGSGKSYGSMRLAELFLGVGAQIIVLDWVGVWWSLRLAADGKAPGFEHVYIFGGEHADVPLEPTSGALMADLIVDKHISVVLDVMHFRKAERTRFATAFAEQFFHRKKTARTACHLFIEEAQAYLPQMVRGDEARMVGVFEDIGKVGRNYGIGTTLISQRPQAINKDVLNQVEVLLAFQTNGPQERKAIAGWTAENTTAGAAMMQALPTLPVGDALVWSPQWLRLAHRVHISERVTYNASSTPTGRAKTIAPQRLAKADLDAIGAQLAATIEKAKADDPRELRKQITTLTKQVADATKDLDSATSRLVAAEQRAEGQSGKKVASLEVRQELAKARRALEEAMKFMVKIQAVDFQPDDKAVLEQAVSVAVTKVVSSFEQRMNSALERVEGVKKTAAAAEKTIKALLEQDIDLTVQVRRQAPFTVEQRQQPKASPRPSVTVVAGNGDLSGPERKILASVAELEALGLHPADKIQVGLMAGYTNVRSGGFSEPLGRLVAGGYVESPRTGQVAITDAGRALVGQVAPPQTSKEMQARVMDKLTGPERRLLHVLIAHYPTVLTKEQLAEACDPPYTNIRSGGFSEPLGRLNTLGLVQSPARGEVVASPALFLEG